MTLDRSEWDEEVEYRLASSLKNRIEKVGRPGTGYEDVSELYVEIDVDPDRFDEGVQAVESAGGTVEHANEPLLQAWLAPEDVVSLATADPIVRISLYRGPKPSGIYEGAAETNASFLHSLGWTGEGVTVAVVDTRFANENDVYGEIGTDESNVVEHVGDAFEDSSDLHGTNSAEVVARMAPDADLVLVSVYDVDRDEIDGLHGDDLEKIFDLESDPSSDVDSVDILTHSLGRLGSRIDGKDPMSNAIADVTADDRLFVTCAGNEADGHHWDGIHRTGDRKMEFGDDGTTRFRIDRFFEYEDDEDFSYEETVKGAFENIRPGDFERFSPDDWHLSEAERDVIEDETNFESIWSERDFAGLTDEDFEGLNDELIEDFVDAVDLDAIEDFEDVHAVPSPLPFHFVVSMVATIAENVLDQDPDDALVAATASIVTEDAGKDDTILVYWDEDWHHDSHEYAARLYDTETASSPDEDEKDPHPRIEIDVDERGKDFTGGFVYLEIEDEDVDGGEHHFDVFAIDHERFSDSTPERSLWIPATSVDDNTLAVAAVDERQVTDYSSRGPTQDGRRGVDFAGPTHVELSETDSYGGTSAAAPHVAGAAALLYQIVDEEDVDTGGLDTNEFVRDLLADTVTAVPGSDPTEVGHGFIDVAAAYEAIAGEAALPVRDLVEVVSTRETAVNRGLRFPEDVEGRLHDVPANVRAFHPGERTADVGRLGAIDVDTGEPLSGREVTIEIEFEDLADDDELTWKVVHGLHGDDVTNTVEQTVEAHEEHGLTVLAAEPGVWRLELHVGDDVDRIPLSVPLHVPVHCDREFVSDVLPDATIDDEASWDDGVIPVAKRVAAHVLRPLNVRLHWDPDGSDRSADGDHVVATTGEDGTVGEFPETTIAVGSPGQDVVRLFPELQAEVGALLEESDHVADEDVEDVTTELLDAVDGTLLFRGDVKQIIVDSTDEEGGSDLPDDLAELVQNVTDLLSLLDPTAGVNWYCRRYVARSPETAYDVRVITAGLGAEDIEISAVDTVLSRLAEEVDGPDDAGTERWMEFCGRLVGLAVARAVAHSVVRPNSMGLMQPSPPAELGERPGVDVMEPTPEDPLRQLLGLHRPDDADVADLPGNLADQRDAPGDHDLREKWTDLTAYYERIWQLNGYATDGFDDPPVPGYLGHPDGPRQTGYDILAGVAFESTLDTVSDRLPLGPPYGGWELDHGDQDADHLIDDGTEPIYGGEPRRVAVTDDERRIQNLQYDLQHLGFTLGLEPYEDAHGRVGRFGYRRWEPGEQKWDGEPTDDGPTAVESTSEAAALLAGHTSLFVREFDVANKYPNSVFEPLDGRPAHQVDDVVAHLPRGTTEPPDDVSVDSARHRYGDGFVVREGDRPADGSPEGLGYVDERLDGVPDLRTALAIRRWRFGRRRNPVVVQVCEGDPDDPSRIYAERLMASQGWTSEDERVVVRDLSGYFEDADDAGWTLLGTYGTHTVDGVEWGGPMRPPALATQTSRPSGTGDERSFPEELHHDEWDEFSETVYNVVVDACRPESADHFDACRSSDADVSSLPLSGTAVATDGGGAVAGTGPGQLAGFVETLGTDSYGFEDVAVGSVDRGAIRAVHDYAFGHFGTTAREVTDDSDAKNLLGFCDVAGTTAVGESGADAAAKRQEYQAYAQWFRTWPWFHRLVASVRASPRLRSLQYAFETYRLYRLVAEVDGAVGDGDAWDELTSEREWAHALSAQMLGADALGAYLDGDPSDSLADRLAEIDEDALTSTDEIDLPVDALEAEYGHVLRSVADRPLRDEGGA